MKVWFLIIHYITTDFLVRLFLVLPPHIDVIGAVAVSSREQGTNEITEHQLMKAENSRESEFNSGRQ